MAALSSVIEKTATALDQPLLSVENISRLFGPERVARAFRSTFIPVKYWVSWGSPVRVNPRC